jgi:hypothetical protein
VGCKESGVARISTVDRANTDLAHTGARRRSDEAGACAASVSTDFKNERLRTLVLIVLAGSTLSIVVH